MQRTRYRWWHGALFYAAVQGLTFALGRGDRGFYRSQRQPRFAPPGAAFPVAWTINGVAAVAGALHVLNLREGTRGRAEFLRFQAAAWALYASFNWAYFGLRSPLNAEIVTLAYTGVTAASLDAALRKLRDQKAALSLAPTVAWLTLANPVGLAQALWNHDPFWNVGPFAEPRPEWLKRAV